MAKPKTTGRFDTREELEEFVITRGLMGAHRTLISKQSGAGEGVVTRIHLDNGISYKNNRPKSRTCTLGATKTRGPYKDRETLELKVVATYMKTKRVKVASKDHGVSLPTVRQILRDRGIEIVKAPTSEDTKGRCKNKEELDRKVCSLYSAFKVSGHQDIVNQVAKRVGVSAPTARKILALNGLVKTKNKDLVKRIAANEC